MAKLVQFMFCVESGPLCYDSRGALEFTFSRGQFFGILVFSLYCEVFDSRDNRIFRGKEVV